MAIYKTSRYNNSDIDYVSTTSGGDSTPIVFYEFSELGRLTWVDYIWKDGDRLDLTAFRFYSNPHAWWLIAEANPEIEDPLNIPAGAVLRVPKRA
jgi:nucleoid-associated protein YgaU